MSTEFTKEDVESLAAKLDSLDLTEAEQAVLGGILERAAAADAEVSGFSFDGKGWGGRPDGGAQRWKIEEGETLKLGDGWKVDSARLGGSLGLKW